MKYASSSLAFNLEGRYVGTTSPSVNFNGQTFTGQNQNVVILAGVTYKFNQPQAARRRRRRRLPRRRTWCSSTSTSRT